MQVNPFPAPKTGVSLPESPHATGDQPGVLHRVLDPGVNLGLWQRPAEAAIKQELSALGPSDLPDVRCSTTPTSFDDDLCSLLRQRYLEPASFENWRVDLRRIADLFFELCADREVILRLETTGDDGCRRFHADRTHLRLLCTYRGPGTQWLRDEQVDRTALTSGAPNERIVRVGQPLPFEPFWVGILKGDAYPGNAGRGLVHRSPPIAGSGQTRVLFCLDC